jgi:hypothetical protein
MLVDGVRKKKKKKGAGREAGIDHAREARLWQNNRHKFREVTALHRLTIDSVRLKLRTPLEVGPWCMQIAMGDDQVSGSPPRRSAEKRDTSAENPIFSPSSPTCSIFENFKKQQFEISKEG